MRNGAVPERVGKYRIDHVIGRGAIGVVFKGYDEQIDRPLAIKTLRPEIFDDIQDPEGFLRHFTAEARAAARCLHPNIVTVFDLVEQEQRPYIVMEYVNAGTLENVIQAGALIPIRQVGEIMAQILLALDHAHGKGVLHRDVKPANILCPSSASIKIADFGVARLDSLDMTSPNGLGLGTPNYMAPERFLGRPADVRTDLFSAGVILHQLLTGAKPFVASDLPELMQKLLNERLPSIMTLRPDLWSEMDVVAQKALARNPEDRFQSAELFLEALSLAIEARPSDNRPPLDLTKLSRSNAIDASAKAAPEPLGATMAARLSPDAIDALSRTLARWLGPISRFVVKQAARETSDAEALIGFLSRNIKTDAEIALFWQAADKLLREDLGLASARAREAIRDAEIKAAIEALVCEIGPIARHLVSREAHTAIGRDDFYRRLAEKIPDERAKTRFLALRERLGKAN
ncbi:serine/threonine protein kinase [Rhodoblastus acidophilus]|uniref:Serine/threonine protein kinase n=1 Tax=Rhodoblastus acidophilus TaxID=1074 RepID=A0A212S7F9_RHOAC|nr:serine/threonine-protein kinase [Rhodoblastus acidophilus]PPQ37219.1 serine/threonine protein kinase [Rhodoblastus acidophilus]RAI17314.1 serine/threonine protein kinase [Rhodoblastus acidophilus]SNB81112.1 serine/threonine protein kinase [Rhodoblastus acidophilus]